MAGRSCAVWMMAGTEELCGVDDGGEELCGVDDGGD